MGHASSHVVQLSPIRTTSFSTAQGPGPGRGPKYQSEPLHRVLPGGPAVALRAANLRSTDNGSILHHAGTIRGGGPRSPEPLPLDNPPRWDKLHPYRSFHSEPDVSRPPPSDSRTPGVVRSVAASNGSKAKVRSRKKTKAPEPPPSEEVSSARSHKRFLERKKNPAPLPPPTRAPPPPTPAPDYNPPSEVPPAPRLGFLKNPHRSSDIKRAPNNPPEPKKPSAAIKRRSHVEEIPQVELFKDELKAVAKRLADRRKHLDNNCTLRQLLTPKGESKKFMFVPKDQEENKENKECPETEVKCPGKEVNPMAKYYFSDISQSKGKPEDAHIQSEPSQTRSEGSKDSLVDKTILKESGLDSGHVYSEVDARNSGLSRSPELLWEYHGGGRYYSSSESLAREPFLTRSSDACEDSGISPDADSPVLGKLEKKSNHKHRCSSSNPPWHSWIPEQDLDDSDDDSDHPSDDGYDARIHRSPAKLTLPHSMFPTSWSLPLLPTHHPKPKNVKKQHPKPAAKDHSPTSLSNLKNLLMHQIKTSLLESENARDPNWIMDSRKHKGKSFNHIKYYLQSMNGPKDENCQVSAKVKKSKPFEKAKFSFYSTEGHVIYLPEYKKPNKKNNGGGGEYQIRYKKKKSEYKQELPGKVRARECCCAESQNFACRREKFLGSKKLTRDYYKYHSQHGESDGETSSEEEEEEFEKCLYKGNQARGHCGRGCPTEHCQSNPNLREEFPYEFSPTLLTASTPELSYSENWRFGQWLKQHPHDQPCFEAACKYRLLKNRFDAYNRLSRDIREEEHHACCQNNDCRPEMCDDDWVQDETPEGGESSLFETDSLVRFGSEDHDFPPQVPKCRSDAGSRIPSEAPSEAKRPPLPWPIP